MATPNGSIAELNSTKPHPLRRTNIPRAVAEYSNGKTIAEIAAGMDVSYTAVWKALAAAGVPRRPGQRRTTVQFPSPQGDGLDAAEVVRLYIAGHSVHALSPQFNVSRGTILRLLRRHDVALRHSTIPKPQPAITCKKCNSCGKVQPTTHFRRRRSRDSRYANSAAGWASECKFCNKSRMRTYTLQRKFGLSLMDVATLVARQDNLCAICRLPPPEGKQLFVDHNHSTGKVRALLCHGCNSGLGMFQEDPERLLNAVEYLKAHAD